MVFLDCGDFMAWMTPMFSSEYSGKWGNAIIRCCGLFALCVPVEKFGDGF
jgi:hypothetical protein